MKLFRTPSFKRSFKARTTGRLKRSVKKAIIPGYGRSGIGYLKNPKRAIKNKIYHSTTIPLVDWDMGASGDAADRGYEDNSPHYYAPSPSKKAMRHGFAKAVEEFHDLQGEAREIVKTITKTYWDDILQNGHPILIPDSPSTIEELVEKNILVKVDNIDPATAAQVLGVRETKKRLKSAGAPIAPTGLKIDQLVAWYKDNEVDISPVIQDSIFWDIAYKYKKNAIRLYHFLKETDGSEPPEVVFGLANDLAERIPYNSGFDDGQDSGQSLFKSFTDLFTK